MKGNEGKVRGNERERERKVRGNGFNVVLYEEILDYGFFSFVF